MITSSSLAESPANEPYEGKDVATDANTRTTSVEKRIMVSASEQIEQAFYMSP